MMQEKDIPADQRASFAEKDGMEPTKAWVTIGYWSKTLISAELNYSTTERECFSVVWALKNLRPYLESTRFVVRSDHDALRWMMSIANPHGRLARWRFSLSRFDYTVVYRPGRANQVSDAISRCPVTSGEAEVEGGIPTFEAKVLAVTRAQALEKMPIGEETDDEDDLDLNDAVDADIAEQRAEYAIKTTRRSH